jgi:hypothetical protein
VAKPTEVSDEYPELTIVYKINDETIDNFMPTKTCLYGKHIVTLFYPISKVIENSSNTFSMYLKISDGSIRIGESQIRATISGQGLAAGLGDWNGRISINENIGNIPLDTAGFMADVFEDTMSLLFPNMKNHGVTQLISDIPIGYNAYTIDSFTDRTWITEILRTFVLTAVRGKPVYNGYVTLNNNDAFILRKRYASDSAPISSDLGFTEKLWLNFSFLESVDDVNISGHTASYRLQRVVNTSDTSVIFPNEVEISNGKFELKGITQEEQKSVILQADEGYLETLTVDVSAFDGVKGVDISL